MINDTTSTNESWKFLILTSNRIDFQFDSSNNIKSIFNHHSTSIKPKKSEVPKIESSNTASLLFI